jgi:hypothetical protein
MLILVFASDAVLGESTTTTSSPPVVIDRLLEKHACEEPLLYGWLTPPHAQLTTSSIRSTVTRRRLGILECEPPTAACPALTSGGGSVLDIVYRPWTTATTGASPDQIESRNQSMLLEEGTLAAAVTRMRCGWPDMNVTGPWMSSRAVIRSFSSHDCGRVEHQKYVTEMVYDENGGNGGGGMIICYATYPVGCSQVTAINIASANGRVLAACRHTECDQVMGGHQRLLRLGTNDTTGLTCTAQASATRTREKDLGSRIATVAQTSTIFVLDSRECTDAEIAQYPPVVYTTDEGSASSVTCAYAPQAGFFMRTCRRGFTSVALRIYALRVDPGLMGTGEAIAGSSRIYWSNKIRDSTTSIMESHLVDDDDYYATTRRYTGPPNTNIMSVRIDDDYFARVTGNGTRGVAVYAECSFAYGINLAMSEPVALSVRVAIQMERRERILRYGDLRPYGIDLFEAAKPTLSVEEIIRRLQGDKTLYTIMVNVVFVTVALLVIGISVGLAYRFDRGW